MSGQRPVPVEPLAEALARQIEAAEVGFDWPEISAVWDKLREELGELAAERTADRIEDELGDVLFVLVNLSRHLGVDPSRSLARANAKFARRFAAVMADPETLPPLGDPARLEAMEARWQAAKRGE